jgi:hypothetical protein
MWFNSRTGCYECPPVLTCKEELTLLYFAEQNNSKISVCHSCSDDSASRFCRDAKDSLLVVWGGGGG